MKTEAFLDQMRNGNPKPLFRHLYGALPGFVRWVRRANGSGDDARDLFQDAMIIVHRKCQDPQFQLNSDPRSYILSVAKYLFLNHYRKTKHAVLSLEFTPAIMPDDELDAAIEQEAKYKLMNSALSSIGEKCMELLHRFFHQKQSLEKIAADLNLRNANVAKVTKFKCLEKARNIVSPLTNTYEIAGKN